MNNLEELRSIREMTISSQWIVRLMKLQQADNFELKKKLLGRRMPPR